MRAQGMALALLLAAGAAQAQDADRSVKGGVQVAGWKARVDRKPLSQGKTANDSRFAAQGAGYRLSVGPAAFFWNDANSAKGDYSVSASFKELAMKAAHPHSYGIFIAGQNLESDTETLVYCIAYGNGTYAIKTFHGATVTALVDRAESPALRKADAKGETTNTIGWRVQGGKASCVINGTVVKTLERGELVAADKLGGLDGTYGIRVSHNLELEVSAITKGAP